MENKFGVGDAVYFLDVKENYFMVGLLCSDKNKNEYTLFDDYNKIYHCGKVEKIHISESGISYDIQTYNCNLYPMELFKEVYECYVFDSKKNAKDYFFKTINSNLGAIKEWCENNKLEDV